MIAFDVDGVALALGLAPVFVPILYMLKARAAIEAEEAELEAIDTAPQWARVAV